MYIIYMNIEQDKDTRRVSAHSADAMGRQRGKRARNPQDKSARQKEMKQK